MISGQGDGANRLGHCSWIGSRCPICSRAAVGGIRRSGDRGAWKFSAQGVCRELIFAGDVLTAVCKNRVIIKVDSGLNVDVTVNLDDSERGTIEFVGLRAVRDGNSYSALQSGLRWHTSGPLLEVDAGGVCRFSSLGNGSNRITCSSVGAKKRAFRLSFDTKGD